MKKILITGKDSYIGTNAEKYLLNYNANGSGERYQIDTISQQDRSWEEYDFSTYDVVFDVTGVAHADIDKVTEEERKSYFQINCDLAVKTAQKAKAEGVKQFIYMSSIIVYGDSAPVGHIKRITPKTEPNPTNFYGESKWLAEQKLRPLEDGQFQIAILRAPLIYGKDSKGNYSLLEKLADKLPLFPGIQNERSMIYIENFCEFLRLLIESGRGGLFFPQNKEYSSTSAMVKQIAGSRGRKIWVTKILNLPVYCLSHIPGKIGRLTNKAFGSLSYDQEMSLDFDGYQIYNQQESIKRIEG